MLRREVAELQLAAESLDHTEQQTLVDLKAAKAKVKQLEAYKAKGWYRRAKVKWAAEGDLPGKFFFSTLKQNRHRNTIPPLPDEAGKLHSTQKELISLIRQHYAVFLQGEEQPDGWEEAWQRFAALPSKVSTGQRHRLDLPFTKKEVEKALLSLPNGKAPGRDGFTKEFVVWGWEFVAPVLIQAIAQIWQQGSMGRTLNESLITLIPKSNAEESIKNWRPISLLSIVYKIITKAMARRVGPVELSSSI